MKLSKQLANLVLKTNKSFFLYTLNYDGTAVLKYRFSNEILDKNNNRNYQSFKVVSCIKKELLTINL